MPAAVTASTPSGLLRAHERAENFPVALRLLPRDLARDLRAVYDVARTIDDLGDDPTRTPSQRLTDLDRFATDLATAWLPAADRPSDAEVHPVVRRLTRTVRVRGLTAEPFDALVEANRLDQRQTRWATYDDLRGYCRLSADPVGRIVLQLFGAVTPARVAWSDDVCTALQLLEHCQDVAEDRRHGRVYLPLADLDRFGVDEADLDARVTSAELRDVVAFEVQRATDLLASGPALVASLRGWARVAVAGFVAGGRATVDALARASYDVLACTPRPRRRDVARHGAALLLGAAR